MPSIPIGSRPSVPGVNVLDRQKQTRLVNVVNSILGARGTNERTAQLSNERLVGATHLRNRIGDFAARRRAEIQQAFPAAQARAAEGLRAAGVDFTGAEPPQDGGMVGILGGPDRSPIPVSPPAGGRASTDLSSTFSGVGREQNQALLDVQDQELSRRIGLEADLAGQFTDATLRGRNRLLQTQLNAARLLGGLATQQQTAAQEVAKINQDRTRITLPRIFQS